MIDLRDGKITDLINNPMSYNPETVSIGYAILQEKQRLIALAERTRLMAVVENLDEWVLDYLAVELRAPAYEDRFPIEVKRELIAGTMPFYAKLGTPQAINWATRTIFGGSQLQEWFEYGGEPYHFRMGIDITNDIYSVDKDRRIRKCIDFCKNLRSHLDGVTYFMQSKTAQAWAGALAFSEYRRNGGAAALPDAVGWPRARLTARTGAAFLGTAVRICAKTPPITLEWPKAKTAATAGAAGIHIYKRMNGNIQKGT